MSDPIFLKSPYQSLIDGAGLPPEAVRPPPAPVVPDDEDQAPDAAPAAPASAPRTYAKTDKLTPPPELRPLFENVAAHFKVPVNVLMALAHQESRYNPNAKNAETGATGMAQYIGATAKSLGINAADPNEAIPAAAMQLRERLDKGLSIQDAIKEHFAGPDRKLWGSKTAAYGDEVMGKAAAIGQELYGSQASDVPAQPKPGAVDLGEIDPGTNLVGAPNFDPNNQMQEVPRAPVAGPAPKPVAKPAPAAKAPANVGDESMLSAAGSYLGHSLTSGMYNLAGAGAKLLDAVNPFTLSDSDAATLFKNDPAKLKQMQDESLTMGLSRFAKAMQAKGDAVMGDVSPRAKQDYGSLEYETLDKNKAAYLSPVKVLGDGVRSLPSSMALAVSAYLTRGASMRAEQAALAAGMRAEAAREAGVTAGAKMMAQVSAGGEGTIGYAQQSLQTDAESSKVPMATLRKSPAFQQLLRDGYTPQTARAKIIADTAEHAGQIAGVVDAATNKVGGEFLGKIISEGGPFLRRVLSGVANESITEGVQSAGEQVGQNFATQQNIDPNQDLGAGVGEAAIAGAAVGGMMGGTTAGVAGHHGAPERAAPAPADTRVEPTLATPAAAPPAPAPAPAPQAAPAPAPMSTADKLRAIRGVDDAAPIVPAAPDGPLAASLHAAAAEHEANPAPLPEMPQAEPEPPALDTLPLEDLQARVKALAEQRKTADPSMYKDIQAQRKEIEKAINAKQSQAKADSKPAEEPLEAGPFEDIKQANKMMLRHAESTGAPHEVVPTADGFRVQRIGEQADGIDTAGGTRGTDGHGRSGRPAGADGAPDGTRPAGTGTAPGAGRGEQPAVDLAAERGADAADHRTAADGAVDAPAAVATAKRTLYHGTRAQFDTFDASRSGGMVSFAESPDVATKYATGGGGAREAMTRENTLIFGEDGTAYRIQGEQAAPIGRWDQDKLPNANAVTPFAEGDKRPAAMTVDQARQRVHDGLASVVPHDSRIVEGDVDGAKLLDTTTPKGVAVIAKLTPTNRVMKSLVESAKMDAQQGDTAQFNTNFWGATKRAGLHADQLRDGIIKAMKDAGYDGIRFTDDGHTSVGLFDTGLSKFKPKESAAHVPESPEVPEKAPAAKSAEGEKQTAGTGDAARAGGKDAAPADADAVAAPQPAAAGAPAPTKQGKTSTAGERMRAKVKDENPFLAFLSEHGIHVDERSDTGAEPTRPVMVPGYGQLYRKAGVRIDELAGLAHEAGFLSDRDMTDPTDNGGTRKLADMIERAAHRKEVIGRDEPAAAPDADAQLMEEAEKLGIDIKGKSADQIYDAVVAAHADEFSNNEARLAHDAMLDADIPLDGGTSFDNLSDEDIDAIFGIKPASARADGDQDQEGADAPARGSDAKAGAAREGDAGEVAGDDLLRPYGREEVVAKQDAQAATAKAEQAERERAEKARRTEQDQKDIKARQDASADNFELGQDAHDSLAGQQDIFGGPRYSVSGNVTETPAFRKFFEHSQVVDEQGKPLVVYHGTSDDFTTFDRNEGGKNVATPASKRGLFFTDRADIAGRYADMRAGSPNIMPVYLSLTHPFRADVTNMMEADKLLAGDLPGDGAIITVTTKLGAKSTIYMVKEPTQVKSATGNTTFDPSNPDIRYSTGHPLTKDSAREVEPLLRDLADKGAIVLHDDASTLPGKGPKPDGVQALTAPDGTIHVVADALHGNARGVVLHEAFHAGAKPLLGTKVWDDLQQRLGSLYRQGEQSTGAARAFFDKARERVATAKARGAVAPGMEHEEFGAYAIEEYANAPVTIKKWVDDLVGAVKAWALRRFGRQLGQVTPAQLSSIAKLALMDKISARAEPAYSADSSKTVQVDGQRRPIENSNGKLIAEDMHKQVAFWRWAKDTKVVDEQGRPRVVYHGTPDGGFSEFSSATKGTRTGHDPDAVGFHFASDPSYSEAYSGGHNLEMIEGYRAAFGEEPAGLKMPPGASIYPSYLRMRNPMEIGAAKAIDKALIEQAKAAGHDGIIADMGGAKEFVVFDPEQVKSATGNDGSFDPSNADIRYSVGAPATPTVPTTMREKLAKLLQQPVAELRSIAHDVAVRIVPMATGGDQARVIAKDFANQTRQAQAQWHRFDKVLREDFTTDQLETMWNAADQENDLRRDGRTSTTQGLNSLPAEQREVVELLHAYGEQLWDRAKRVGLVKEDSEGVHYWTPRMAANIYADGSVDRIASPGGEFSKDATNLKTSANSTKRRHYETTAESEAALQTKHGADAAYVKNIRVMPLAMAQLEQAIAGRSLINQVKGLGQIAGADIISDSKLGKNYETFDHPALKNWMPKTDWMDVSHADLAAKGHTVQGNQVLRANGVPLSSYRVDAAGNVQKKGPMVDSQGKPVLIATPLYVHKDFVGPMKAVLKTESPLWYRRLMQLKGAVTSMVMISPLTHNMVIWGKAMPTMASTMGWKNNAKNIATLGMNAYVVGYKTRQNAALMNELIGAGLVPVSGRGMSEDVQAIAAGIEPGKSWTAQALGAVGDLAGKDKGDAVRRGVDKAGEFWHETLLWNRVADMQAGMAVMLRGSLLDKGFDQDTANRFAVHFANRYAGMVPQEAMSQSAHIVANLALFSKSFNLTNVGAYKDAIKGLPGDVQAQILRNATALNRAAGMSEEDAAAAGKKVLSHAQATARKKGATILALDIAAMTAITSIAQALWQGQGADDIKDDFKKRAAKLGHRFMEDPLTVMSQPLQALASLSQGEDNAPGKEDRVRLGSDKKRGDSYYMRLPMGKMGEELKNYTNFVTMMRMGHNKMSTFARPFADLFGGNEDFQGQSIVNEGSNVFKQAAQFGAYWVKSQFPAEDVLALARVANGTADTMDKAKLLGTATGLTVARVAGGDAVAEIRKQSRDMQAKLRDTLPEAKEAIRRGKSEEAMKLLMDAGQTPRAAQRLIMGMENPGLISKGRLKTFMQTATPEEREKVVKMIQQK